jgi:type I restriction enzyme M protein
LDTHRHSILLKGFDRIKANKRINMFEIAFDALDETLRKDEDCNTELDYIEQASWILFLKYLDDYEIDKELSAKLNNNEYAPILAQEYRWQSWAAPKTAEGKIDRNKVLTGDDLKQFVDNQLFPYLCKFKTNSENFNTIEYKIGQIFSELKNKLSSGYSLREAIDRVDELRFKSNEDKHELTSLYEDKIKRMGNAGRNGGEYYTPRPLIKAIIKIVNPKLGETIYDGAAGSCGFLCEAYDYLRYKKELSAKELELLQKKTLYGNEKKSLAYIVGLMNMILHGIETPNLIRENTLSKNINDIQEKDRFDIVLANPPFGSTTEHVQIQENFPIRTGETAYMFLQHFIKKLKINGRAGIVIKSTFLSINDNASIFLRKQLIEECNLQTILVLPTKVFQAGVPTVVLFFTKGSPTKNIWFYEADFGRNLGKTNPLDEEDLKDFVEQEKTKANTKKSWTVEIDYINKSNCNLTPNNPNRTDEVLIEEPNILFEKLNDLTYQSDKLIDQLKNYI